MFMHMHVLAITVVEHFSVVSRLTVIMTICGCEDSYFSQAMTEGDV
jgi:hypothetical protein